MTQTARERARSMAVSDPLAYQQRVEEARQAQNRKSIPMGKYRTKQHDTVDIPDGVGALHAMADDTYKSAVEAFDAVQEVKARNERLASTTAVDTNRFPSVRGE